MINTDNTILWPLLVYGFAVLAVVGFMLGLSYLLGQRHKERETDEPYEGGTEGIGTARTRFPIHFYIVAMFFVIFDLEVVFIVAWAIAFYELGWTGYIGASIFIFILTAVLIYEWRIGALNFGLSGKKVLKEMRKNQTV